VVQLQKGVQPMSDRSLFAVGFVLGAMAGAAAALLMTPYSGEEMRGQLKEKGIELKTDAERVAADAKAQAAQMAGDARAQAQQLEEKGRIVLSENVKKAQEAVQSAQTKLGKADTGPAEVAEATEAAAS
jgi:gas vesicle protein